jgi:membrane-associated phospholipid phosphatase
MKQFLTLIFFLSFFIPKPGMAQEQTVSDTANYLKLNKEFIISGFADARDVLVSPVKWKKNQWLGFAAFAGTSVLLYSQDENIRDFFQRNQSQVADETAKYGIEPWGSGIYLIPLIGGMYVYGLGWHHPEAETAALLTGKVVVIAGGFTLLFKGLTGRHRPNQDVPADHTLWEGPFAGFAYVSFPSGHTALAFSAATVLSAYYREKTWVAITTFSLATLVGISRIYNDEHWASDVFGGAVLGYAIGRLVYNNHLKKSNFTVFPYINGPYQGLSVNYLVD